MFHSAFTPITSTLRLSTATHAFTPSLHQFPHTPSRTQVYPHGFSLRHGFLLQSQFTLTDSRPYIRYIPLTSTMSSPSKQPSAKLTDLSKAPSTMLKKPLAKKSAWATIMDPSPALKKPPSKKQASKKHPADFNPASSPASSPKHPISNQRTPS